MKRKFILVLIFINLSTATFAHKEWVHQYMVQEAAKYLIETRGINTNIFTKRDFGIGYGVNGGDVFGWQNQYWYTDYPIVVGAWKEDDEDIVWKYDGGSPAFDASACHFWVADGGDAAKTWLHYSNYSFRAENAWTAAKMMLFYGGSFNFVIDYSTTASFDILSGPITVTASVDKVELTYNNIFDLYNGNFQVFCPDECPHSSPYCFNKSSSPKQFHKHFLFSIKYIWRLNTTKYYSGEWEH
jgi:hypothetical protein